MKIAITITLDKNHDDDAYELADKYRNEGTSLSYRGIDLLAREHKKTNEDPHYQMPDYTAKLIRKTSIDAMICIKVSVALSKAVNERLRDAEEKERMKKLAQKI